MRAKLVDFVFKDTLEPPSQCTNHYWAAHNVFSSSFQGPCFSSAWIVIKTESLRCANDYCHSLCVCVSVFYDGFYSFAEIHIHLHRINEKVSFILILLIFHYQLFWRFMCKPWRHVPDFSLRWDINSHQICIRPTSVATITSSIPLFTEFLWKIINKTFCQAIFIPLHFSWMARGTPFFYRYLIQEIKVQDNHLRMLHQKTWHIFGSFGEWVAVIWHKVWNSEFCFHKMYSCIPMLARRNVVKCEQTSFELNFHAIRQRFRDFGIDGNRKNNSRFESVYLRNKKTISVRNIAIAQKIAQSKLKSQMNENMLHI